MSILSRLLEKRGITEDQLSGEEKVQFEQWKGTLSDGEISVEKIKGFSERMIKTIENKWKDWDISNEKKSELIPYHTVYKAILDVIGGSKVERENLEKYLETLINK